MDGPFDYLMAAVFSAFAIFCLLLIFVFMPRALYVDAKCLEAGYPKSSVTWNLRGYCIGLDGSTYTVVEDL